MNFSAESYASYHAPIVMLIFIVIGVSILWLVVLAAFNWAVQRPPAPPIVPPAVDHFPTILSAGFWLHACGTVVGAAAHQVTLALRGHTHPTEDHELGQSTPSAPPLDVLPACPPPATPPGIRAQETTPTSPPSPKLDAGGLPPTDNPAQRAFISTTGTESVGNASTSTLSVDATPWPSFVAPWDLIAASSTPRASSDLGHPLEGPGADEPHTDLTCD